MMNLNRFSRLGGVLVALTAIGAGATGAAAQNPSPLPGVFGEVLDVRVVNFEVTVVDKDGVPIAGLDADDFRLAVDGEEVPIDYFSEVRAGSAVAGGPATVPGMPALAPGEPVGTSYLVFVDEFFSIRPDRNQVLEGLVADLPRLGPEDRMAIVAYDGRELEMLTTWSSSVSELTRVLNAAKTRPTRGLQRLTERRQYDIDEDIELGSFFSTASLSGSTIRTQLTPLERSYIQLISEQLDRSVAAASATLRSFAKPPGRKVMLLLSGGWPYLPTDFLVGGFQRVLLDREGLEGEGLYGRLVDTANLLGYTIYPVDVPGLDRQLVDASRSGFSADSITDNQDQIREQEVHYTLRYLARQTGGKPLINAARREAFSRAVSDTRSYYWIGFSPARAWDDKRHEVKVEVVNADFRVRTRAGFLDSSRQREVTMAVESALLFGNAPAVVGGLSVEVGETEKAGRRRMLVPLELMIPLDQVTFVPYGSGFATQLELRVAVIDESGNRAEIPVVPITLEMSESPAAGELGRYQTSLKLRRQKHDAVVAIYDPASGRILSTGVTIAP